ncbi:MAG: hypothetical protein ABMA02_00050 [Saprospiraceae bacterium]
MNTVPVHPPFTNLQLEILKLFARQLPDADLLAIRDMIARYLLERALLEADKAWNEKGYTVESFQQNVHEKS